MKKIISFSLWGNQPRYIGGAIQNIKLAKILYPDWICRFYIGNSIKEDYIKKLLKFDNVEIINMNVPGDWRGMFWRFSAISEPDVSIMIVRDADSRLSKREAVAVKEWENSNFKFHIMRDNPQHATEILGGMWGSKKGIIDNINILIDEYSKGDFWQVDQNFLKEKIWPIIKDYAMIHDEFFDKKQFPQESGKRDPDHFVGQAYAGDGSILDKNNVKFLEFLNYNGITIEEYENTI